MNTKNVSESILPPEKESPRNVIFQEIFSENFSKKFLYNQKQKTQSNYLFIILLNLVAFILALFGCVWVYHVFKTEEIRLIEGHTAVKTLEISVLEQLNQKREKDIQCIETELQQVKVALEEAEKKLAQTKKNIKSEAEQQFALKKSALETKLTQELQGKNIQEQALIRAKYQEEIDKIEKELNYFIQTQYKNLDDIFTKEQQTNQQQIMILQKDIEKQKLQLKASEKQIQTIIYTNQVIFSNELIFDNPKRNNINKLFLSIQTLLQNSNFPAVNKQLKKIKLEYDNDKNQRDLPIQDKVDLFIITILEEYVTNMVQLSNLSTQLSFLQTSNTNMSVDAKKLAENRKEIKEIYAKIDRLQKSNDILLNFQKNVNKNQQNFPDIYQNLMMQIQSLVVELNKGSKDEVNQQIKLLHKKEPIMKELLESYSNYQFIDDTEKSEKLFNKAEKLFGREDYDKALDIYQSIIRLYPKTKKLNVVLEHMYVSMKQMFQNTNFIIADSLSPTKLQLQSLHLQENIVRKPILREIIYLQNPEGYVLDITKNNILVYLLPNSKIKNKSDIQFFRIINDDGLQFHNISDGEVNKIDGNIAYISQKNIQVKIGDLIYLKKKE
ncbi:MAG: hypothetical protein ACRCVW_03895 [Brevinema sp.]